MLIIFETFGHLAGVSLAILWTCLPNVKAIQIIFHAFPQLRVPVKSHDNCSCGFLSRSNSLGYGGVTRDQLHKEFRNGNIMIFFKIMIMSGTFVHVVTGANLWFDWIGRIKNTAKNFIPKCQPWAPKSSRKWVPGVRSLLPGTRLSGATFTKIA